VSNTDLRVGFFGLGRMGRQMAARVAQAGFPINVWNRSAAASRSVADATGATAADHPADAARGVDVLITMLTDGPALLSVLGGPQGALTGLGHGAVVVDCSTIGAQMARAAARLCADAGVAFLDSPVSGSTAVAGRGELGVMVGGGDERDLQRVQPVLDTFARTVVHVGPTGTGATAKVAVNALLHTFSTALAESLVTAEAAGVSRQALFNVLAAGVLSNTFLDYKREAFVHPDSGSVAFDLATATKDLGLALPATREAGLTASVVERVLDLHRSAVVDGYGDKDMAAMAAWFSSRPVARDPVGAITSTRTLERT
jgi:3-hydroxyisobutyrate dehydrogenase-like beta-hydroxyacid dehydrogenase